MKRIFLLIVWASAITASAADRQPNIVWLVAEDMSPRISDFMGTRESRCSQTQNGFRRRSQPWPGRCRPSTPTPRTPPTRTPTTPAAEISDQAVQRGDSMAFVVSITCHDPGASIGYRLSTERRYAGPWQVYTGPFEVPANLRFIEVQTHRIGHLPTITGRFLGGE